MEILFQIKNNYYKCKDDKFYIFGGTTPALQTIGSWFKCDEEKITWIRKKVLNAEAILKVKIPGTYRLYKKDKEANDV